MKSCIFNYVPPPSPSTFTTDFYYSPGSGSSPGFGTLTHTNQQSTINQNWGSGGPGNGVGNNDFQVKWTGEIYALSAGIHNFRSIADDGVRLYIDGQLIINDWTNHGATNRYGSIFLDEGYHNLEMHFYEDGGGASVSLYWTPPGLAESLVTASVNLGSWVTPDVYSDTVLSGDTSILKLSIDAINQVGGIYA